MDSEKINVKTYIDQFNIIGNSGEIDCENLSYILYGAILNKFKITMSQKEYYYFKEYQERIFDLVENLREMKEENILLVFDYLEPINQYLPDIVIMLWCLPRTDSYLSKRIYNIKYKDNISKYNSKIVNNIKHRIIQNFCIESLTKTNNIPIHCIDYIWYYMNNMSFDFTFYNSKCADYIGISMPEKNESDQGYTQFGFNMEFLLEMGLGNALYVDNIHQKGTFKTFLKKFITDVQIVTVLFNDNNKNYCFQLKNICNNLQKYFGEEQIVIPAEIIELISGS